MASTTAARKRDRYQSARATYGSVAYDLSYAQPAVRPGYGGEEVGRPRPLVRPREGVVARPQVQTREAGSVSIFAVVGFLAVGVFAILVLMSSIRMITLSDDIAQLKTDLGVLQKEEAKLRTQYELAFDQTTIEKNMTSTGTMVKPQDGQILYLDLSAPDSVVLFQEDGQGQEGAGGPLAVLREIFDHVKESYG